MQQTDGRRRKVLVLQVAALGHALVEKHWPGGVAGLRFAPLAPAFPALTCTSQAEFRTASPASAHGMVGNGFLFRDLMRPMFWEQSAKLVAGPRIWDRFRAAGGRVAMLFWQQSLGESVDMVLSPAPIHKHHGGMIQDCYGRPDGLYGRLSAAVGSPFDLKHYWGPFASARSSEWIARATAALLADPEYSPDLCLSYLPVLDYDLQRHGPDSSAAANAMLELKAELEQIVGTVRSAGFDVVIYGDYAIVPVTGGALLPNLALREAGLFSTRVVRGRLYPDFHTSAAFAVADHEVAHVYVRDAAELTKCREVLSRLAGVGSILDKAAQAAAGIAHARSGDLVLTAAPGHWIAYPWWTNPREAPDYATHVDIHNKPGYDPCELFMGSWLPPSVATDTSLVRGSHGAAGHGREVAFAATVTFDKMPRSIAELGACVADYLGKRV